MLNDRESLSMDTARNLAYLGSLPFLAGAVGPWVFYDAREWLTRAFLLYSLAVFSFLCGSIWSTTLQRPVPARRAHLFASQGFMVSGWIALFLPHGWGLGLLIVCYLALYGWERHTHLKHELGPEYLLLRQQLTWPVVACHMLALFNLIRAAQ